ncbi:MAG TPA: hypothetical protein VIQ00_02890 [Chitinophagaceae bacterium]
MILGFKQQFPDNTPTNFKEKILSGEKIHSIRAGNRWKPGMSIQMAYGVRTKNYKQFNYCRSKFERCVSVQRIFITYECELEITVGMNELTPMQIAKLIKNDGLTRDQFIDWFLPEKVSEFSGQIIHWTDYQY